MNVAIVGDGAWFFWPRRVERELAVAEWKPEQVLVRGELDGADRVAMRWASWRGVRVRLYAVDRASYGLDAVGVRDRDLARASDAAVVFWDGRSKVTSGLMDALRRYSRPVHLVRWDR